MGEEDPTNNGDKRDDKGRFTEGNRYGQGRPKGSLSLVSLLKDELKKEIETGDSEEKITYAKALVRKILKKAIKEEDVQMIRDIINRVDGMPRQSVGIADETPPENRLFDLLKNADEQTKRKFIELFEGLLGQGGAGGDLPAEPSEADKEGDLPEPPEGGKE